METITLNVPGMSCSHCEKAIKGAVSGLDGVDKVDVDLANKKVKVSFNLNMVSENTIKTAIEDQGYEITE